MAIENQGLLFDGVAFDPLEQVPSEEVNLSEGNGGLTIAVTATKAGTLWHQVYLADAWRSFDSTAIAADEVHRIVIEGRAASYRALWVAGAEAGTIEAEVWGARA